MTDLAIRARERAALLGGPDERAVLLRDRMRAGELTRDAVELAAYCGDEACRKIVGKCACGGDCGERLSEWCRTRELTRRQWLTGLSRWPHAPVLAAVAAGWVAYEAWLFERGWWYDLGDPPREWKGTGDGLVHISGLAGCKTEPLPAWAEHGQEVEAPGNALRAAERWLVDPSEEHKNAATRLVAGRPTEPGLPSWALGPIWLVSGMGLGIEGRLWLQGIQAAADLTDPATVREVIREALIESAL